MKERDNKPITMAYHLSSNTQYDRPGLLFSFSVVYPAMLVIYLLSCVSILEIRSKGLSSAHPLLAFLCSSLSSDATCLHACAPKCTRKSQIGKWSIFFDCALASCTVLPSCAARVRAGRRAQRLGRRRRVRHRVGVRARRRRGSGIGRRHGRFLRDLVLVSGNCSGYAWCLDGRVFLWCYVRTAKFSRAQCYGSFGVRCFTVFFQSECFYQCARCKYINSSNQPYQPIGQKAG